MSPLALGGQKCMFWSPRPKVLVSTVLYPNCVFLKVGKGKMGGREGPWHNSCLWENESRLRGQTKI